MREEWNIDLKDFFRGNMWEIAESGMVMDLAAERKKRRWVVRIRMPDFKGTNELKSVSSGSRSTLERRLHSTSFCRRTGRPLLVTEAGGNKLPLPPLIIISSWNFGQNGEDSDTYPDDLEEFFFFGHGNSLKLLHASREFLNKGHTFVPSSLPCPKGSVSGSAYGSTSFQSAAREL